MTNLRSILNLTIERIGEIFSIDRRSLALFRICFAMVLLADLWWRASDLAFFYSDRGMLTRAEAIFAGTPWGISINMISGAWEIQAVLFAFCAVVFTALLLGFKTELAAVLSWFLIMSLHRRNPQILQGGDNLIRCLSFWIIFVPLGAVWSLDARSRRIAYPELTDSRPEVRSAGTMFLILQIAVIYLFSYQLKTGIAWRIEHSAVYYALSVEQLTKPFGRELLAYPLLLQALTYATIWLEKWGPLLLFVPYRNTLFRSAAIFFFLTFHIGLALTMELGPFPYVCISAWLLFIPPEFWNFLARINFKKRNPVSAPAPSESGAIRFKPAGTGHSLVYRISRGSVLAVYFGLVVCWNIRTLDFEGFKKYFPTDCNFLLEIVALDQQWGMFAPYPINWDGWYQIEGKTRSGKMINLSPGAAPDDPITDQKPARVDAMYKNERWRKYLMFLASQENTAWRGSFVRGMLNQWADSHPRDPLEAVDVYFWFKLNKLEGPDNPEKMLLWHYETPPPAAAPAPLPAPATSAVPQ